MNENLDLTKILDGCPKGTEFYHTVYGIVWFNSIIPNNEYPILLSLCEDGTTDDIYNIITVTEKGIHDVHFDGECILFPSKDQRDWSKFKRFWDKPKAEKFNVNTLQLFDKILARNYRDELWSVDFFSHKTGNIAIGLFSNWHYVIPYNEVTKHLVGTRDDCPEYYKWWEK